MRSFLTLFPALALALLLTACGAPEQPQMPKTPVSVERALNEAMQQNQTTDGMDDMNGSNEVNVELDAALETLQSELDAALSGDIEIEINEPAAEPEVVNEVQVEVEAETNAEPNPETISEETATTDQGGQVDTETQIEAEELIDQPIIIE